MKIVMKLPLAAAIAIRDDIRNFHYTDGGGCYTSISEDPGRTTHWTSGGGGWSGWCVEIEGLLTFTGSRTSFRSGCAIGGVTPGPHPYDPDLCWENWVWSGKGVEVPVKVVEVRSSLPRVCPWKYNPWAPPNDVHGWLEEWRDEGFSHPTPGD